MPYDDREENIKKNECKDNAHFKYGGIEQQISSKVFESMGLSAEEYANLEQVKVHHGKKYKEIENLIKAKVNHVQEYEEYANLEQAKVHHEQTMNAKHDPLVEVLVKHATRDMLEYIVLELVEYTTREQLEYLAEFMLSDSPIKDYYLLEIYKNVRSEMHGYEEMLEYVRRYINTCMHSSNYNPQPEDRESIKKILDDIERMEKETLDKAKSIEKPYVEIKLLEPITDGNSLGYSLLEEILDAFEVTPLGRDWFGVLGLVHVEGIARITFSPDLMIRFWGSRSSDHAILLPRNLHHREIPFNFGIKADVFEAVSNSLKNHEKKLLFPVISLNSYDIEAEVTLRPDKLVPRMGDGVIDIIDISRWGETLCRIQKIKDINAPIPGTKSDSSPDPGDL